MKDSGSEMIKRDWVMKQKRRKLPSILDILDQKVDSSMAFDSPEYTSSSKPSKQRLKTDSTPERNSSKRKGNDGVTSFYLSGVLKSLSPYFIIWCCLINHFSFLTELF
jgi:hypothetical protein